MNPLLKKGFMASNCSILPILTVQLTSLSCTSTPIANIYPNQNVSRANPEFLKSRLDEYPHTEDSIQVLLDNENPKCKHTDIGAILYDSTRDSKLTSKQTAIEGVRKVAAPVGATGIYKLEFEANKVSSSGTVAVQEAIVNNSISTEEYSLKTTAYVCLPQ